MIGKLKMYYLNKSSFGDCESRDTGLRYRKALDDYNHALKSNRFEIGSK